MSEPFASRKILLRVTTANESQLKDWAYGVWVEQESGRSLGDLRDRVVADRLALAIDCRRRARRCIKMTPPMYRDAVSRAYYATYHACRSWLYFSNGGDDHQDHREFWKMMPDSFGGLGTSLRNDLKNARLRRNEADYDPYPKSDAAFRIAAQEGLDLAIALVSAVKRRLQAEGCGHI